MKINSLKKCFILYLISLVLPASTEAIKPIWFYGIASKDADKNMLSMTENLYFSQLKEMNISITDKRNSNFSDVYFENPDTAFNESSDYSTFYAVIKKLPDSKWECKLFIQNPDKEAKTSIKIYDSYYKIMMESKLELNRMFSELISGTPKSDNEPQITEDFTVESLSGTWTGELNLSKIVLMRGGRGFVIFKNGASMNISSKIETDQDNKKYLHVTQTSSNNASYYPELDRKTALEAALNALPVTWKLYPDSDGNLYGTKETFTQKGNEIKWDTVKVFWKKN